MSHENWTLETRLVHNQNKTDGATGAVSVPISTPQPFIKALLTNSANMTTAGQEHRQERRLKTR
jgi:cystathionine beta-lyase/cystathionine gamma-synthase